MKGKGKGLTERKSLRVPRIGVSQSGLLRDREKVLIKRTRPLRGDQRSILRIRVTLEHLSSLSLVFLRVNLL